MADRKKLDPDTRALLQKWVLIRARLQAMRFSQEDINAMFRHLANPETNPVPLAIQQRLGDPQLGLRLQVRQTQARATAAAFRATRGPPTPSKPYVPDTD
jgi:hypothetical protein